MNIFGVIIAAMIVGGTGIIIAVLLGIAGEKFKIEVDEREIAVREALPGNNCGGCGYPGCDGLAAAIMKGEAELGACPVGGEIVAQHIATIMGSEVKDARRMVAVVKCSGTCEQAKNNYIYVGPKNCKLAMNHPNSGEKSCSYGCTGYGSCKEVCPFGAIDIIDGIAVINKEKCKACKKCIAECPKGLIELVPYDASSIVKCNSQKKGKDVKAVCGAGCIGCGLCARNCGASAITLENNLAYIDQNLCNNCGICKEKCPVKVIHGA